MTRQNIPSQVDLMDISRSAATWLWLSIAAALLAMIGSLSRMGYGPDPDRPGWWSK